MRTSSPISTLMAIGLLLLTALGVCAQEAAPPQTDSLQTWYSSYDAAAQVAQKNKRHLLLVFQTEWCPWSRAMNDSCWVDPGILAMSKRTVFTRIDGDLDTFLVSKYSVRRFPTTILATDQGIEVDRFVGYYGADELQEEIVRALEGVGTLWEIERLLKESRNDGETLLAAARECIERGEFERARGFLERALLADAQGTAASSDDVMFIQAQLLREESNWYKAIEGFRQLVKKYPESEWREDAELYIPWLYAQAGDTTEAVKRYNDFLDDYGSSSETHWVKRQIERLTVKTDDEKSPEQQGEQ